MTNQNRGTRKQLDQPNKVEKIVYDVDTQVEEVKPERKVRRKYPILNAPLEVKEPVYTPVVEVKKEEPKKVPQFKKENTDFKTIQEYYRTNNKKTKLKSMTKEKAENQIKKYKILLDELQDWVSKNP